MKALTRIALSIAVLSCPPASAQAAAYSGLYAFGDSLTDIGNVYTATGGLVPTPAYYTDGTHAGRFTNGPNYFDVLARDMSLSVAPSYAGGTDYAFGGARTNYSTSPLVLSFNQQIAQFDSSHAAADPNALYVLWIGANDMSDAIQATVLGNPSAIGSAIQTSMTGIGNAISDLSGRGAQHFLVMNLPNLALTPAINSYGNPTLSYLASTASTAFNSSLSALLGGIAGPGIQQFDVYSTLDDVVANPAHYGLSNVTNPCYTGEIDGTSLGVPVTTCANPDQYLFWDYEHPTAATHRILGDLAYASVAAVPEPADAALMLLGLAFIGVRLRRQAKR